MTARVLHVTSRLVLLDVIVTDSQGHAVTDLKQGDFTVLEDSKQRAISSFELIRTAAPASAAAAALKPPVLPPGIYSNRPQFKPPQAGAVCILLLDALNSTYADQTRIRLAMLQYADRRLAEGQTLAVMSLSSELNVLQDFTSDPKLLRTALQRFRQDRTVLSAANDKVELSVPSTPEVAAVMAPLVEHVKQFEAERAATTTDLRVKTTLAALRAIASAVAGYPGRKNLVWVSDAFPIGFSPDWVERMTTFADAGVSPEQVRGPIGVATRRGTAHIGFPRQYTEELRQTAALLTAAQVAVYPVDALGLLPDEVFSSAKEGKAQYIDTNPQAAKELLAGDAGPLDARNTMRELADSTGGKAFYGTNDIELAVSESVGDAATYYQISYTPAKDSWDAKYHRIEVKISRPGVNLRTRRGYYATNPADPPKGMKPRDRLAELLRNPLPATGIIFDSRMQWLEPGEEGKIRAEFLVHPESLQFDDTSDGQKFCALEFTVAAFATDGKLMAIEGETAQGALRPETYGRIIKQGLPHKIELRLKPGTTEIRLAVRDLSSGKAGTLRFPLDIKKP